MECLSVIEKSDEYVIQDESVFCPKCKIKINEIEEESSISIPRQTWDCNNCKQTFIKEIFIDCINKKIEVKLKKI